MSRHKHIYRVMCLDTVCTDKQWEKANGMLNGHSDFGDYDEAEALARIVSKSSQATITVAQVPIPHAFGEEVWCLDIRN